ncbi:hypothetical protein Pmani_014202 [Petrolisthes manimaculis]|uniref:Uncharacterized protein n=1 Tax=Petrolisthes manimaculis TaxID=1843537 RepID=A0AAE1PWW6_9EUCA|nr:hypothetical protein Pmani_014202 [Petrolisthes manimaculis]
MATVLLCPFVSTAAVISRSWAGVVQRGGRHPATKVSTTTLVDTAETFLKVPRLNGEGSARVLRVHKLSGLDIPQSTFFHLAREDNQLDILLSSSGPRTIQRVPAKETVAILARVGVRAKTPVCRHCQPDGHLSPPHLRCDVTKSSMRQTMTPLQGSVRRRIEELRYSGQGPGQYNSVPHPVDGQILQ